LTYCLDTNVVIAAFNGDPRVAGRLASASLGEVIIPLVVVAELLYGAQRSSRRDANLNRVRQLGRLFRIAPIDDALMERYAAVRARVESTGRAKSDFDLLIACCALEHGATLVTNDAALKAGDIEGLHVEDWLEAGPR
jgi:tRNA(fMet)-specific endonuclease VapC